MDKRSIKEYYKGKTIFLTGGSGFVGKVLIEKLLRSCPDLQKIYMLLRPKRGKSLYQRVEQITSSCLFDELKKVSPENLEKIVPIQGDTSQLGLELSDKDRLLLIDEVQIVFNAAASVKFDDFLKDAILTNIRSAREAALVALDMKKIEVFMHVSTAYCNIDEKQVIEPKLYMPNGDWNATITIAEQCDKELLNTVSRKILGEFPNTYTYTKHLGEHCVNDLLVRRVPTVIFRPSVVIPSLNEPIQGWVDNLNGPVGLLCAGGSGLLRVLYGNPDIMTDYVFVDNVVKSMIVAAWHSADMGRSDKADVYHGTKYKSVLFKKNGLIELGQRLYWDVPFARKIWWPRCSYTTNWYYYFINVILFQVLPALFIDILLRITGYPPMLFKLQRKIYVANLALNPFMLSEWYFVNTSTVALQEHIPEKERSEFEFLTVPETEDEVYNYYKIACDKTRHLLLKESKEITEKTRTITLVMYYLDRVCLGIFYISMIWLVFVKINIHTRFWDAVCNYWNGLEVYY